MRAQVSRFSFTCLFIYFNLLISCNNELAGKFLYNKSVKAQKELSIKHAPVNKRLLCISQLICQMNVRIV